ncbi:energy transducer TonB [Sulfurimonas microaerophilic]|uniref:energy transducer TonB n=1 Tax=Sulfurimonas microaerophilic TaxID=3058392 RepID=UPI00271513A6|nr:energy transducer TonB [Sulfurimonas sp. hsl 1-7]
MSTLTLTSVISYSIQQNRYLKLKAFFISLFLHALLLALTLKLASVDFIKPKESVLEKATLVSLSSYEVIKPKKQNVKTEPKTVPITKRVLKQKNEKMKKVVQKQKEQPVVKPIEQETLQQEQSKEAVVPAEAFTPQIPDTEQKIEERKILIPQNSPLSEQKLPELALIRSLIQNALKYPAIAKRLHLEGVVVVSFSLSTTGEVSNLQLVQSSDSSVLDKRALQTVSSLDGEFPHINQKVDLKIPIAFSLQHS